jgi:CRP-like cAMP-binding protein
VSAPLIPLDKQVRFLAHVPLMKGLDDRLLGVLAGAMELRKQKAGTLLCNEGGPGNACFILASGAAEIFTNSAPHEQIIARLAYTAVVGEVALLDGKPRSASVRCLGDVTYFVLMRDVFERLIGSGNPAGLRLLDNLARVLAQRVRIVNQRYADIFSQAGDTIAKLEEQMRNLRSTVEVDEPPAQRETEDLMKLIGYEGR